MNKHDIASVFPNDNALNCSVNRLATCCLFETTNLPHLQPIFFFFFVKINAEVLDFSVSSSVSCNIACSTITGQFFALHPLEFAYLLYVRKRCLLSPSSGKRSNDALGLPTMKMEKHVCRLGFLALLSSNFYIINTIPL